MWLIDTRTLRLEFFPNPEADGVRYAILSHRWLDDEVSFQDFANPEIARCKAGYDKITKTCARARQDGLSYAWVDTCCIDKSSSAELTESVNSMYAWYKSSAVCYAYLSDISSCQENGEPLDDDTLKSTLGRSVWFTRGWTLQELIAPEKLEFFDTSWHMFGVKKALSSILQDITGIEENVLNNSSHPSSVRVCDRMSWAAKRETTRTEDMAYCLLGIFDVNMPLIYGEGYKAFQRLQQEIANNSNDLTLFFWSSSSPELVPARYRPPAYKNLASQPTFRGAFAWAPSEFVKCSTLRRGQAHRHSPRPTFELESQRGVILRDIFIRRVRSKGHTTCWLNVSLPEGRLLRRLVHPRPGGVAFLNRESAGHHDIEHGRSEFFRTMRLFGLEDALRLKSEAEEETDLVRVAIECARAGPVDWFVYNTPPLEVIPQYRWCELQDAFTYSLGALPQGFLFRFSLLGAAVHRVQLLMQRSHDGATRLGPVPIHILSCVGLQGRNSSAFSEATPKHEDPLALGWPSRLCGMSFVKESASLDSQNMHAIAATTADGTRKLRTHVDLAGMVDRILQAKATPEEYGVVEIAVAPGRVHRLLIRCEAAGTGQSVKRWAFRVRCSRLTSSGVWVPHEWGFPFYLSDSLPSEARGSRGTSRLRGLLCV